MIGRPVFDDLECVLANRRPDAAPGIAAVFPQEAEDEAVAGILADGAGSQWDPALVERFAEL